MAPTVSLTRVHDVSREAAGRQIFLTLLTLYSIARLLQVYPLGVPMVAIVALHVVPLAIFALLHGSRFYGWSGIITFFAITLLVGNFFENLGVHTGFPYGHYYFTGVMGPKFLVVPIMLGLAYVGMAYLSWTLARLMIGGLDRPLTGWRVITLPLIAALVMTCWDLCLDPVWSTILHAWIWRDGGIYFGVPIANFFGWYLAVYIIYQLFALYLARHSTNIAVHSIRYWRETLILYSVSAAGNLLLMLPQSRFSFVSDFAGISWRVRDITIACGLVTILTMGTFSALAWMRLRHPSHTNASNTRFDSNARRR